MLRTICNLSGMSCLGLAGWKLWKYYHWNEDEDKLKEFFKERNLYSAEQNYPTLINHEQYSNGELYIYSIPNGCKFSDFTREQEGLEHLLKGEIEMWNEKKKIFIRSYTKPIPKKVKYGNNLLNELDEVKLGFPVGYSARGVEIHDFLNEGSHLLVAGTTNYGKSNFLHVIIQSMMDYYTKDEVDFNLLDLKEGVEFNEYQEVDYADNLQDTKIIIEQLKEEMKERSKLIKSRGYKNINKLDIPYIITIVDEFARVSQDRELLDDFELLLQQGRMAGLHFVLSTQYPKSDIIPTNIRINCDSRIAFRLKDGRASNVVLKNDKASNLPPIQGRGIYCFDRDIEVQVPLIKKEVQGGEIF